jgi:hypothetical protein
MHYLPIKEWQNVTTTEWRPNYISCFNYVIQGIVNYWVYLASVLDDWGRRHGMILTGERLTYMEKNLCLCHSVYHKSHMDCRGYWIRAFAMRGLPLTALFKMISSFFLSFLFWPLLPTHCRWWLLLLHLIMLNDKNTHTLSTTPLDEWSAYRRDLYLTTHNTHKRQTSMSPAGFDPAISASERPQNPSCGTTRSYFCATEIEWKVVHCCCHWSRRLSQVGAMSLTAVNCQS